MRNNKQNKNENAYKAMGYGAIAQLSRNKRIRDVGKVAYAAGSTTIIGNGIVALFKLIFWIPIYAFYQFCIWVPFQYAKKFVNFLIRKRVFEKILHYTICVTKLACIGTIKLINKYKNRKAAN